MLRPTRWPQVHASRAIGSAALARAGDVLQGGGRALGCIAAGMLTASELRAAIAERWQDFGATEAYVRSGLWHWEMQFYSRFLHRDDDILLVGAGSGRDLLALREQGYRADGLELAERASARARALVTPLGGAVVTGSIEVAPLAPRDAFIFSWLCYSYIPGRGSRVAVLRRVHDALRPEGRILLTYARADGTRRGIARRLATVGAWLARVDWRPEPGDVIERTAHSVHYEHEFTREDIEAEARAAGLAVACHEHGEEGRLVLTA
jgi:SAM-dependent methyltransferase